MADETPAEIDRSAQALTDTQNVEAVLAELEGAVASESDIKHRWFAVYGAIQMLGAGPVHAELYATDERFRQLHDGETAMFDGAEERGDVVYTGWIDWMADFGDRAGGLLGAWLTEHDLPEVKLFVFLPCHFTFAPYTFTAAGEIKDGFDRAA